MSATPGEPPVRRRYVFHGRVQGVGFRASAHSIAARHPVAGYVRNCPDGTVELVLEGAAPAVEAVLTELGRTMLGCIERCDEFDYDLPERFDRFEIRR